MKKHISVLAAIVGLVIPLASHAGPSDSSAPAKKGATTAEAKTTKEHRTYYYITGRVPTGSNIPVVIRRDGTDTSTMSVMSNYSHAELDRTGAEDIAGELVKVDPAIMLRSH